MRAKPIDWNAVVLGAWNVAILSPEGIARRLFRLEPGTPIELQVPIDGQAPIRVIHDGFAVAASSSRLVVTSLEPTDDGVCRSAALVETAISSLPETPVSAAGVNLRYQFDTVPDRFLEFLASPIDDRLADSGHLITMRAMKRTIRWKDGLVNIDIQNAEDASALLAFNFHRSSSNGTELRQWLNSAKEMVQEVSALLGSVFGVDIGGPSK